MRLPAVRALAVADEGVGREYTRLSIQFPGCPPAVAVPVLRREAPSHGLLLALPPGAIPHDRLAASEAAAPREQVPERCPPLPTWRR